MAGIDTYEQSLLQAAPDIELMGEGCSDEGVPITTLLKAIEIEKKATQNPSRDLQDIGVEENCLTYVWWRGCFKGSNLNIEEPRAFTEMWKSGETRNVYNSLSLVHTSPNAWLPSAKV